jgi:poly(A) polymerase
MEKSRAEAFAPDKLYRPALQIVRSLQAAGHEAYIAGGAVRDHLLGREQSDIDIATSAPPEVCTTLFKRTVAVGESFGVIIVMIGDRNFEVATFRKESGYQDGRHPEEVSFCSAKEDVSRRDFTVNGLFWDTKQNRILDWVGGEADIHSKLIRCIGSAEARFKEDHLRMLRALRFAAQLGFTLEAATQEAIKDLACHISLVSMERIRIELEKLLKAEFRDEGLALMQETGLGQAVWARLFKDIPEEWRRKPRKTALEQGTIPAIVPQHLSRLRISVNACAFPVLSWWVLLMDLYLQLRDNQEHATLSEALIHLATELENGVQHQGRALRFSKDELSALRVAQRAYPLLERVSALRLADRLRLLRHPGLDLALQLYAHLEPLKHKSLCALLCDLSVAHVATLAKPPLLTGHDLIKAGVKAGPAIGLTLGLLETEQLEGRIRTHEDAVGWIKSQL